MGEQSEQQRIHDLIVLLKKAYPEVKTALRFSSPLELLIATILSAQCTDERVNKVTEALFRKYPSTRAYAEADLAELEQDIKSTGFFHNKARNIKACCEQLERRFQGRIPSRLEDLVQLPGVGRKTANVILGNAFQVPAMVVDTHVKRVSARLGLTRQKDPDKIEQELMAIIPRSEWIQFSHLLIFHGRRICKAPKPSCPICPVAHLCPSYKAYMEQYYSR
ncbi:MAG: endonuclease III [bacterium]